MTALEKEENQDLENSQDEIVLAIAPEELFSQKEIIEPLKEKTTWKTEVKILEALLDSLQNDPDPNVRETIAKGLLARHQVATNNFAESYLSKNQ